MTGHCDLCREPAPGVEPVCDHCGFAVCPCCLPRFDEVHAHWHGLVCGQKCYDEGDPIKGMRNAAILSGVFWGIAYALWCLL